MAAMNWTRSAICLMLVTSALSADAAGPQFRRHVIDADSTYAACAVVDVDRDGQLDVISGGWWYQGPDWKRHFLREVEEIRGRFDDYSNLPLDVNADGWTDYVSANYRSKTIYWIEHPGRKLGPWTTHTVARPGPSETARLVDVDGDGQFDLLPNGTKFAAWWEVVRSPQTDGRPFRWVRHELPDKLAGHGIGFGDIDGDGRYDLVGPRGWAKAPKDRRRDRWQWFPEFELHRDGSIPILVYDVDADGDSDIAWGRGHGTGLYWMEQTSANGERTWIFHAIDTSWSQPHSLLLGDLDQDGRSELIAGKRYLGHDGKDLGEYDPMIVCSYGFLPASRSWQRTILSIGKHVGFGLDPKLADLDADGDLDIVCPGRSGLYWLENLHAGRGSTEDFPPPRISAASYESRRQLLTWRDPAGQVHPVKSPADWGIRRAHILANLQLALGELPNSSRRIPLNAQVVSATDTPRYTRRELTYAVEPGDRVPAYLLIPKDRKRKAPAVICLHRATSLGKDEPAGLGGDETLHYAHELAERGFVCLVPDYPSFGDNDFDVANWQELYVSRAMKAVWNNIRAVDLLESLPEVDRDRIGCIGHALGARSALLTAVFDQRIGAVVASGGVTAFAHEDLVPLAAPRRFPQLGHENGAQAANIPVDWHEVVAAIAPRPLFVNTPQQDEELDVAGVKEILAAALEVYALLEAADVLAATHPNTPQVFSGEVPMQVGKWLDRHLK